MNFETLGLIISTITSAILVAINKANITKTSKEIKSQFLETTGASHDIKEKFDNMYSKLEEIVNSISRLETWKTAWMELSDNPIFILDNEGRCIWVNGKFFKITGTIFPDIEHYGWHKIIHPEDRSMFKSGWLEALQNHSNYISDFRIINQQNNSQYTVTCRIRPLARNQGYAGFLGILDI